jgi:transportin-3
MVHTIAAMLEEIQALYQQHNQSCFLYLSSEVIKVSVAKPNLLPHFVWLVALLFANDNIFI